MKNVIFVMIAFFIVSAAGCKSAPSPSPFDEVLDIEWKLIEVRTGRSSDIKFNRDTLISEGFPDIFTLTFESETFGGKGAPNTYNASFTLGNDFDINVQSINTTQMALLTQPEKLKEHDFLMYIQNLNGWKLADEKLELTTKGENGNEIKMVFAK